MKYTSYSYPSGRAEVAAFVVTGGVTEYHVMIHATDPKQTYREQMNAVLDAYAALLKKELPGAVAVFKRYFLSDAANQAELLPLRRKAPIARCPWWNNRHWMVPRLLCGHICRPMCRHECCQTDCMK